MKIFYRVQKQSPFPPSQRVWPRKASDCNGLRWVSAGWKMSPKCHPAKRGVKWSKSCFIMVLSEVQENGWRSHHHRRFVRQYDRMGSSSPVQLWWRSWHWHRFVFLSLLNLLSTVRRRPRVNTSGLLCWRKLWHTDQTRTPRIGDSLRRIEKEYSQRRRFVRSVGSRWTSVWNPPTPSAQRSTTSSRWQRVDTRLTSQTFSSLIVVATDRRATSWCQRKTIANSK